MEVGNAIALSALALTLIGVIYKISRFGYTVEELEKDMSEGQKDRREITARIARHEADGSAHVNHLYIGSMKEKVDKLETTFNGKFDKMEQTFNGKIDKLENTLTGGINDLARRLDRNYNQRTNSRPK